MNTAMGEDLLALLRRRSPRDPTVRAVVFTGAGDQAPSAWAAISRSARA